MTRKAHNSRIRSTCKPALAVVVGLIAGLACFVSFGSAAVTVSQSAWSWGSPTPQGNTLNSIDFVQGRGYAAGYAGTVLRTDDRGMSWTGLSTGTSADLSRLQVIDKDTLVILASNGCVLRRSDDGGTTFHKIFIVAEQNCPAPVRASTFVDRQIGYLLLADGSVLKTSDGGQSFSRETAVPGTQASNNATGNTAADIAFTNADRGFVFVSPPNGAPTSIFTTSDGGTSWKPVDNVDPGHVRSAYFVDATNGFAVGANTMLVTTDGGTSWTSAPAGAGHDLTSIRCSDPQTCLMTTPKGDILVRTTDGGATATEITASSQPIYAAAFASPTQVTAVGSNGATVISDDGGVNYSQVSADIPGEYFGLRAGPAGSAFALGQRGGLAVSTNGGATWKTLAITTSEAVRDVSFPTPGTGYAIDAKGVLWKTANAGTSWVQLDTGTTVAPLALAAIDEKTVLLIGPKGLRRSNAAGQFVAVGGKKVNRASLDSVQANAHVIAVFGMGSKNLFVSTDQGNTWRPIKLPPKTEIGDPSVSSSRPPAPGATVDFVDARHGFLIDMRGRLWSTANAGKSWKDMRGPGTDQEIAVVMPTLTDGFLVMNTQLGDEAEVLRTSNGGQTWRPQLIAKGGVADLVSSDGKQAYALLSPNSPDGPGRDLFFTNTGGDAGTASNVSLTTAAKKLTVKRLKAVHGRITVTGTLAGAVGGEQVTVSHRDATGTSWQRQTVSVGANGGTFTTSWPIHRTGYFVAQWAGDSGRAGAGSQVLQVTVAVPPKKKARKKH